MRTTSSPTVGCNLLKGKWLRATTYIFLDIPRTEIQRLINQAAILRPTTKRLLQSAGIERGMRVLDLGCGAGDVSMLAGELVGASGWLGRRHRSQCAGACCCAGASSSERIPPSHLHGGFGLCGSFLYLSRPQTFRSCGCAIRLDFSNRSGRFPPGGGALR